MNIGLLDFILCFYLDGLDMVFEGRPRLSPRTLCPYCKILARVMQSSESLSDLAPPDMGPHIFKTLNDGHIDLVLTDLVIIAHRWAEIPHARQCTLGFITHWIEDVALVEKWIPCRDEIQASPPWMWFPRPLMLAFI
jgi:hypothetical protein